MNKVPFSNRHKIFLYSAFLAMRYNLSVLFGPGLVVSDPVGGKGYTPSTDCEYVLTPLLLVHLLSRVCMQFQC